MPGLYLLLIALSAAGVAALDVRFRLAFGGHRAGRPALAIAIGTGLFVAWDAAGIAAGVFVKGGSALYVGVDVAPHLPLEEPLFLAFLCYLALVVHAAAARAIARSHRSAATARQTSQRSL